MLLSCSANRMLANAGFVLDHPDQASDTVALTRANIEGTLRAYRAILRTNPTAKWSVLDRLASDYGSDVFEKYVTEAAARCSQKK